MSQILRHNLQKILETGDECVIEYCEKISSSKPNKILDARIIAEALQDIRNEAVSILFTRTCLDVEGLRYLHKQGLLSSNCKVTALAFKAIRLTRDESEAFHEIITDPRCKVKLVLFERNGKTDPDFLRKSLTNSECTVKSLAFRKCVMTLEEMNVVRDVLQHPDNKIEDFCFNFGEGSYTIPRLAEGLLHPNNKVKRLEIRGSGVTNENIKYLAEVIRSPNCKLTSLHLDRNDFGNVGITDLINSIRGSCIRQLYVAFLPDATTQGLQDIAHLTNILESKWFDVILTLLAVRYAPRLGGSTTLFHAVSDDLIRKIAATLPLEHNSVEAERGEMDEGEESLVSSDSYEQSELEEDLSSSDEEINENGNGVPRDEEEPTQTTNSDGPGPSA